MIKILKRLILIISYRIDLFFDGVSGFIFPPKRRYIPELELVFTFGGIDYYTYKSLDSVPIEVMNKVATLLPIIYCDYPDINVLRAINAKLKDATAKDSISIKKIYDCIDEIDLLCGWRFNTFELINLLSLLLMPNKDLDFKPSENIKRWSLESGFLDFVFEAGVLFSINTIVLDREKFKEYLIAQRNEIDRLGVVTSGTELDNVIKAIDNFLELTEYGKSN